MYIHGRKINFSGTPTIQSSLSTVSFPFHVARGATGAWLTIGLDSSTDYVFFVTDISHLVAVLVKIKKIG